MCSSAKANVLSTQNIYMQHTTGHALLFKHHNSFLENVGRINENKHFAEVWPVYCVHARIQV